MILILIWFLSSNSQFMLKVPLILTINGIKNKTIIRVMFSMNKINTTLLITKYSLSMYNRLLSRHIMFNRTLLRLNTFNRLQFRQLMFSLILLKLNMFNKANMFNRLRYRLNMFNRVIQSQPTLTKLIAINISLRVKPEPLLNLNIELSILTRLNLLMSKEGYKRNMEILLTWLTLIQPLITVRNSLRLRLFRLLFNNLLTLLMSLVTLTCQLQLRTL